MGCVRRSSGWTIVTACLVLTACGTERATLTTIQQNSVAAIFEREGEVLTDDAAQLLAAVNLPRDLDDESVWREATQHLLQVDTPGDRILTLPSVANADVARPADVLNLADVAVVLATSRLDEANLNEAAIAVRASRLLADAGFTVPDVLFIPGNVTPQPTIVWMNAEGGSWNEPLNWSEDRVPTTADSVEIDLPATNPSIIIDTNVAVRSLTSNEALQLATANSLTVTDGISLLRGGLTLEPDSVITVFGESASLTVIGSVLWDGASAIAQDGGKISLPATTYTGGAVNSFLRADGMGSEIDLSALTRLSGTSSSTSTRVNIAAFNGGAIDLSNLTQIVDNDRNGEAGGVSINAGGTDSQIDLSSLVNVVESNSLISVSSGSHIVSPQLIALKGVALEIPADPGTLDLSQIESFTNGNLKVVGTAIADFSRLTSIRGSNVEVLQGGTLALPRVSDIDGAGFAINGASKLSLPSANSYAAIDAPGFNPTFEVTSAESVLDLSALTSLSGPAAAGSRFSIRAFNGGTLDLSNVTQFQDGGAGSTVVSARDVGSVVNFAALTNMTENGKLDVSDRGSINVPNLAIADSIELENDGTGSINLP